MIEAAKAHGLDSRAYLLRVFEALPTANAVEDYEALLPAVVKNGEQAMLTINQHLKGQGLLLREGTIVDASIISAPSSTKSQTGSRDPKMHQTKKGNHRHFGMKMHIGVDEAGFGYAKVRYRGLHKNTQRLALLLGFTNLLIGDTYEFA